MPITPEQNAAIAMRANAIIMFAQADDAAGLDRNWKSLLRLLGNLTQQRGRRYQPSPDSEPRG